MFGILVALAVVALAVVLKHVVEVVDEVLDERDEMRRAELQNRLLSARLKREREARE